MLSYYNLISDFTDYETEKAKMLERMKIINNFVEDDYKKMKLKQKIFY